MSTMQRTAGQAVEEILAMMNETNDTVARGKAQQILWRALETVWMAHAWRAFQSPYPMQVQLVVNQRLYPLPDDFGRVGPGKVRNLTRGYDFEDEWDPTLFERAFPEAGTTLEVAGSPCRWLRQGTVGVKQQPSPTFPALSVVSTSASDTTVRVTVSGLSGIGPDTVSGTLNGLTPVALPGNWGRVDSFSKGLVTGSATSPTSVGQIILFQTLSLAILEILESSESARQYQAFVVHPKPSVADVVIVPYIRQPVKPTDNSSPLPQNWWPALFEECCIQYRVNTGELSVDSTVPRPALMDLIALDNSNASRPRTRSFATAYFGR